MITWGLFLCWISITYKYTSYVILRSAFILLKDDKNILMVVFYWVDIALCP